MPLVVSPAIVVAAHDRPAELQRLLESVLAADIGADTPLVISIDGGGTHHARVRALADRFRWPYGPYAVVDHEHLGLVEHFHRCGDLTQEYEAIVLLEDDLVVGPGFHRWASAALAFAARDQRIAGVSLATPFFDGYRHLPFEPVIDGSDGIYAQVPWYDGMAWTDSMWGNYRAATIRATTPLHRALDTLDGDEWFPNAMRYLVQTDRYYLLPRHAHATNSGAPGAHFDAATNYFQVPLTLRAPADWRLMSVDESLAIYDDHLELDPGALKKLVPDLNDYDLTVDLLGTRDLTTCAADYVLTTRSAANPVRLWGASMHPLVANLTHNVIGDAIRLAQRKDVIDSAGSESQAMATLTKHADRGRLPSGRQAARQLRGALKKRWRREP